jgi:hypothetical protein
VAPTLSPPGDRSAADPSPPEAPGGWRSNLTFAAEIGQKLAIPLLTVVATGFGLHLSHEAAERQREDRIRERQVEERNNRLAVQNQREQSETSLRSTMFKELVGPLLGEVGSTRDPVQAAQQLALLAELLTLNFHEHFELGPALHYVDRLPSQTQEARQRLRGTARRVISRQLAPMVAVRGGPQADGHPDYIELTLEADVDDAPAGAGAGDGSGTAQRAALPACRAVGIPDTVSGLVTMSCMRQLVKVDGVQVTSSPLIITSPDGRDRVHVRLSSFDWSDQTVSVSAEMQPPEAAAAAARATNLPRQRIEFTLSPYSLPFSDNTLLPSGNRFGLYIRTVDEVPGFARIMKVWFVWFPRDFVPPRERPINLDLSGAGSGQAGA